MCVGVTPPPHWGPRRLTGRPAGFESTKGRGVPPTSSTTPEMVQHSSGSSRQAAGPCVSWAHCIFHPSLPVCTALPPPSAVEPRLAASVRIPAPCKTTQRCAHTCDCLEEFATLDENMCRSSRICECVCSCVERRKLQYTHVPLHHLPSRIEWRGGGRWGRGPHFNVCVCGEGGARMEGGGGWGQRVRTYARLSASIRNYLKAYKNVRECANSFKRPQPPRHFFLRCWRIVHPT